MSSLLCCYFPTKVVFVDDNSLFLKSVATVLDKNTASYNFIGNPYTALEYINNAPVVNFSSSLERDGQQKLNSIYETIYNPKRHEVISTVVVDYQMPRMNGLEFCEKIQNPNIRKILHTGVADEHLAIEAFNKGLIDGYIKKSASDQAASLKDFVGKSQEKYFQALTKFSVESILKDCILEYPEDSAFYDPVFINYFNEIVKKYSIQEYYLNDSSGTFVCLTAKGNPSVLFTYPEDTFDVTQGEYQTLLEEEQNKGNEGDSSSLMEDLEAKRIAVCCFPFIDKDQSEKRSLMEDIYPIKVLQGKHLYYTAYAPNADYLNYKKIVSFDEYKRSL